MKTIPPTLRNCVGLSVLSLMLLPAAYGQSGNAGLSGTTSVTAMPAPMDGR